MRDERFINAMLKYGEMFDYDYFPNEPSSTLTMDELTELYEKCVNEKRPWQDFVKVDENPDVIY